MALLEVAAGLCLLFAILSVLASSVIEVIASSRFFQGILPSRAHLLRAALEEKLGKRLCDTLYQHPLIGTVSVGKDTGNSQNLPSYLPPEHLALGLAEALIQTLDGHGEAGGKAGDGDPSLPIAGDPVLDPLRTATGNYLRYEPGPAPTPEIKAFASLFATLVRRSILLREPPLRSAEKWADEFLQRLSGRYRRKITPYLWLIGILVAVALNINTLQVARTLWTNGDLRVAVFASAESAARDSVVGGEFRRESLGVGEAKAKLDSLPLPLGWPEAAGQLRAIWKPCRGGFNVFLDMLVWVLFQGIGWAITAAAVAMGAPFWFDLMIRIVNLRNTGVKPPSPPPDTKNDGKAT